MAIARNTERHSRRRLLVERSIDNNGAPIPEALEHGLGAEPRLVQIRITAVRFEIEDDHGNAVFRLGQIYRGERDLDVEFDVRPVPVGLDQPAVSRRTLEPTLQP
jgi:hypothetical protein